MKLTSNNWRHVTQCQVWSELVQLDSCFIGTIHVSPLYPVHVSRKLFAQRRRTCNTAPTAIDWYLLTTGRSAANPPAAVIYGTDGRTPDRYIDPAWPARILWAALAEELWDPRCQMLHMLLNFCKQELLKTDMTVVESEKYILILSNVAKNVFRLICQAICGENE